MSLDFQKQFGFKSNIAFGTENLYSVQIDVNLANPTVCFCLSNIHQVNADVNLANPAVCFDLTQKNELLFCATLANPAVCFDLSNIHQVNADVNLANPTFDFNLSRIIEVAVDVTLANPAVCFCLSNINKVNADVNLSKPTVNFEVIYDNNVWRGLVRNVNAATNKTKAVEEIYLGSQWVDSKKGSQINKSEWNAPAALQQTTQHVHIQATQIETIKESFWQEFSKKLSETNSSSFIQLLPKERIQETNYKWAIPLENSQSSSFIQLFKKDTFRKSHYNEAVHLSRQLTTKTALAKEFDRELFQIPWQLANVLNGISIIEIVDPVVEPPTIFKQDIDFIYDFLLTQDIEFKRNLIKNRILKKRFYYMLHQISVKRKQDKQKIAVNRIDIDTDVNSWGWRLSATVIGKPSFTVVKEAMPLEIEVVINDYKWTFVVTDIKESRTFGNNAYSLTGLSTGAYLGEIYNSPKQFSFNESRTIQQLMNLQLPIDWQEVDYSSTNWSVPAYSYANQTPIQAIMELAKVSGSFVNNDRNLKSLMIKPKYPDVPWNFENMLSDYVLPVNPIISMSKEFQKGKNYNAVYVAGTNSDGILGYVKRDGTAGDIIPDAPLSHQLIVNNDAARAYGTNFLIENMDKWKYGILLPLGGDIPLFTLGSLIKVLESQIFSGVMTDLSISVSVAEREVSVRQQITLENFI